MPCDHEWVPVVSTASVTAENVQYCKRHYILRKPITNRDTDAEWGIRSQKYATGGRCCGGRLGAPQKTRNSTRQYRL